MFHRSFSGLRLMQQITRGGRESYACNPEFVLEISSANCSVKKKVFDSNVICCLLGVGSLYFLVTNAIGTRLQNVTVKAMCSRSSQLIEFPE